MAVEHDIKQIKEAMFLHNEDDNNHFEKIHQALQESRDIHIENGQIIKAVLDEAKKTNGRITKLEDITKELGTANLLMNQTNNNITKILEKQDSEHINKDQFEPIKRLVYGATSIILSTIILAVVYLVIKK